MSVKFAYIFAIIGAALWGTTGFFVQNLQQIGFSSWDVVGIRAVFSAFLLLLYALIANRKILKIKLKHLPTFIGTGIVSIVLFNYFFFTVMDKANLSLAVVLLYTGPLFVTLLSRWIFRELISSRKLIAIFFTLIGCTFSIGLLPQIQSAVPASTILFGVASGFFFALYSIFAKIGSQYYHSITITLYSFICAGSLLFYFTPIRQSPTLFLDWSVLLNSFGLAIFPTVLAYILYTEGLKYIESSRAAILSTIEPVIAIMIGFLFFHDSLTTWQLFGVILVIFSIIIATGNKTKKNTALHSLHLKSNQSQET